MDHLRRLQERTVQRLRQFEHRRDRQHTVQLFQPERGRLLLHFAVDRLHQRVAIGLPQGRCRKTRIGRELGPADRRQQLAKELVGHAHDEDPAVRGRKGLHRSNRKMRAARLPRRDEAVVEVPGRDIAELMQCDVEQTGVDVAALAGRSRLDHGRQQPDRHRQTGGLVDHRGRADTGWRTIGFAGQIHQAGFGLHQIVIARPGGTLVVTTIGRHMHADQFRIAGGQRLVVEPHLRRQVAAQIVDHRIGRRNQFAQRRLALGRTQVDRDALLVDVEGLEILAVIGP